LTWTRESLAVDEVVPLVLQVGRPDVEPSHLDVRPVEILEEARIDVSGNHLSGWPDPLGEPARDGTGASSELEAPPTVRDSDARQAARRLRVVDLLEHAQTRMLLGEVPPRSEVAGISQRSNLREAPTAPSAEQEPRHYPAGT
jgi:hypothetical protein